MIRVALLAVVLACADAAAADPKYAWDLREIYPSESGLVGGEGRRGRRHSQDHRPAAGSSPPPPRGALAELPRRPISTSTAASRR